MNKNIQNINTQIAEHKRDVVNHPLYNQLNSIEDVQKLMEVHVYAVWDFMSLLKGLQIELTRTTLPWKPIGDNKIRRLINSIVLEEESDVDADGNPASHYEMYLDAMKECGANTTEIEKFVDSITNFNLPKAFTFGREDLIPDMFTAIVNDLSKEYKLDKFVYYLERHIELDGGEHGPLALQLITDLCGDDKQKWQEVEQTAKDCLVARKALWDVVLSNLR